ncbi:hypothetical protein [Terrilactibacillus laevilacticus]|uniref:YqaJ viral recombinase domain-containing protein n=1 Tax=Terrilactibacillus laevilacticus TaxID=1380157 RepID=A0ABW5PUR0_9BACI|nr:hypothetical protein [Terrilactibacillus laevilacticus]
MTENISITFKRTDHPPIYAEETAKNIADFFNIKQNLIAEFCYLIQTSKRWTMNNLSIMINKWKKNILRLIDGDDLYKIVDNGFSHCQNDRDIHILRGAMLEGVLIGCSGGSKVLEKDTYGWGATVHIKDGKNINQVQYNCILHKNIDCKNRSTIDLGYWNGECGDFYECKVQPKSIGCKEIMYMESLREMLESHHIKYNLYFVCACPKVEVNMRLRDKELDRYFKGIGVEDLELMVSA